MAIWPAYAVPRRPWVTWDKVIPPYFFGTSGFLFTMSSKPVLPWYTGKLVGYAFAGTSCNPTGAYLGDMSPSREDFWRTWTDGYVLVF